MEINSLKTALEDPQTQSKEALARALALAIQVLHDECYCGPVMEKGVEPCECEPCDTLRAIKIELGM